MGIQRRTGAFRSQVCIIGRKDKPGKWWGRGAANAQEGEAAGHTGTVGSKAQGHVWKHRTILQRARDKLDTRDILI
jgi:hypothetical protein